MKIKTSLDITPHLEEILLQRAGLDHAFARNSKRLKKLAADVKKISGDYIAPDEGGVQGLFKDRDLINAYLLYYLPVNLVKLHPLLDELAAGQDAPLLQGSSFSLLDLGCGPGTFLAGFLEYCAKNPADISPQLTKLFLAGIDREAENVSAASHLINDYLASGPLKERFVCKTAFTRASITSSGFYKALPENACFDLITAGNVINEVEGEKPVSLLKTLEKHLSPRGALIIIDPGTRRSSQNLLMLRDLILRETALTVSAPCLTSGPCPAFASGKEWCHEKIFWNPPTAVKAIDDLTGFTKQKGIKFSYFTFVHPERSRPNYSADLPAGTVWRTVSYLIKNKGEERLYVCNGAEKVLLRRLVKNTSGTNADFTRAQRGDLVAIDGGETRNSFLDIKKESGFKIISRVQGSQGSRGQGF